MKKLFILFLFVTLFLHTAFAYNVREDSNGSPLYAADRIKVKLSEVAAEGLNLVLTEEGDYSNTGLERLDNLFESIEVSKIKLAHRPVLDKVWEQEHGFDRWYLLFVPIGTDIENTITDISRNEYIEHAITEHIFYLSVTPNDSFFDECWGHNNNSVNGPGSGHVVGFDSHIQEAWDDSQGYGNSSIIIAIIDTGVDYNHEDLDGNCVTGYDYGDGDSDPMDDSADEGHGTCCAGIAAGEVNNTIGVSGVAGNCKIMPLKISNSSGSLLSSAIIDAVTHCGDFDVDIASMSFGSSTDYGDDPSRDAAMQYAYDNGVTLLACTHNYNNSTITNPANDPNVIAVGAASPCAERKDTSSCDGQNWWGSNYGVNTMDARNAVDVIAPTILPATDVTGTTGYSTGNYIMDFNGTSCSTPYAAGVAALIKSKNTSLTPAQIRGFLTSTATDVQDEEPTAGWDRYTGYGMVNADAAVGAVVGLNIWDGSFNRYWSQAANWSLGHVPLAGENVYIPDVALTDPMYIDFSDAECMNLTIDYGVELQVKDQALTVNGDLTVSGHINMLETNAIINVMGDVDWESGSNLTTTVNAVYMNVYGNWDFSAGANVNPTQGYIDFKGSGDSWIRSYNSSCSFYRLRNYKSGGGRVVFSNLSSHDVVIENLIYTTSSSVLASRSNHAIIIRGSFNYYGTFDFTELSNTGSVVFDGTTQGINNYSSGSGIFNNVVFSASTSATLVNEGITVAGNLTIEQGVFNPADYTVTVGGDWTNSVGAAGFTEGAGRVIFNGGNYHQYCSSETFNELEVNKTLGGAFRVNGTNVICAAYDWTAGTVDVLSGSFTANDLLDNAIQGGFYLNSGGTIDLTNSGSGTWVDLKGDIHIFGGTMTVAGTVSSWPYAEDASIEMSGGVLDFTSCSIYLSGSNTLTETITGGTIRTAGGFTGVRTDFHPLNSTIELYGTMDGNISMGAGSYFYNVLINKSATDNLITKKKNPSKREEVIVDRDGSVIELTRSEAVNVASDIDINGDLQIDNGTFNLNGNNVNVLNDVYNYGLLTVAVSDTLNTGNDMYLYSGSVVDLSGSILLGTRPNYYGDAIHYTGSTFNQTNGDYYVETIKLYDGSQFNGTGGITHIYANGSTPATNAIEIDDPDSYFYSFYVDTGANAALVGCSYDLDVSYATQIRGPLDINSFTMNVLYSTVYEAGDLIIDSGGVVNVTSNGPYINSLGALTMVTGSELNSANDVRFYTGSIENVSGGDIYLEGSLTNSSGIFTPTGGSVTFDGNAASLIIGTTAFHDLNINKTGSVVTTNAAFSMNDLVINSGILNPSGYDIEVYGDWTNNVDVTGFIEGTQTVTFSGANAADITTSETFYNFILDKTFSGFDGLEQASGTSLHVLNDLIISDGTFEMNNNSSLNVVHDVQIDLDAGLNAGGIDTGLNLYVGGNWTNNNIDYDTIFGYTPGGETITFYGSTDQIITTAAPQEDFGNLVIDKSVGKFKSNDNIRVIGDLDIITGNWHDNASSLTHYFEGDFFVTAGATAWWSSLTGNTVVFKGTADQSVYNPFGVGYFRNVIVDKTAWPTRSFENHEGAETQQSRVNNINLNDETRALTVTLTSSIDMEFGDGLTIEEGTLDLNGNIFYTMGDVNINDGGTIIIDEGAQLRVNDGDELAVNSGGILEVLGTSSNLAAVTHRSTGNYAFNVNSGGTISAEYGLFEYMTDNGVYVRNGGFVDPLHSFNYCTFQNGYVGPGTLLYVENDEDLTITGANFPDNSSTTYNVAKITNQGTITMNGATGIFAGELKEYDPNNRITWGGLPEIDDLTIQYSAGNIILNWTYSATFDHFKVYRSTDPYDFSGATIFTTPTVGYSEPATGTNYFYQVTADNTPADEGSRGKTESSDSAPWSK